MKTFSATPSDIERKWFVIDAEDVVLGRLAAVVANRLRGKHKAMFTGDHIVIVNAEKIKLTGRKLQNKKFYWHTGYPGGIKERTMDKLLNGDHPERVIQKAVERMMSRGPLRSQVLSKLHVYAGTEHPHDAQQPEVLDLAAMNDKNKRSAK